MAPAVERPVEKKRSGIRRLLSPVIFSDESNKRKDTTTKLPKLTKDGEVRTAVETAFIGTPSVSVPRTKINSKIRSRSFDSGVYYSGNGTDEQYANIEKLGNHSRCRASISVMTDQQQYCDVNSRDYAVVENRDYRINDSDIKFKNNLDSKAGRFIPIATVSLPNRPENTNSEFGFHFLNINCNQLSNIRKSSASSGRISAPPVPYSQYYNRTEHNYQNVVYHPKSGFFSSLMKKNFNQSETIKSPKKEVSEKNYVIKKRHSPILSCGNRTIAITKENKNGIPKTKVNRCRAIIRPQPLYCNTEEIPPRPKSVSPNISKKQNSFIRGTAQRSTVCGYYPRQSVIYEEEAKNSKTFTSVSPSESVPIFKRGTLFSEDIKVSSSVSKKVSFTSGVKLSPTELNYLRSKKEAELSSQKDFTNFENLNENCVSRMLPSVEKDHYGYGTVNKVHRCITPSKIKYMKWQPQSESESGSEAGEIQKILRNIEVPEEESAGDSKGKGHGSSDQSGNNRIDDDVRKSRSNRRDDPRRHTLTGDHHVSSGYQNNDINRSVDLEFPLSRGYPPPSNLMLFDEDPGIMSEVETSSTGFRRGNKQRSSLPVVRTPSKTLERPLGLVFLQYRSETKRSLLPNEITSLDTVKALFVRSFPKQLSMEYLDSPQVKIYIHDSNKDMFYELEDLRSHLNEIRDRSVLRLFESADVGEGNLTSRLSGSVQMWNDPDQSYFSEPEFDSEFQHQHIHKTKGTKGNLAHQPYYMTHSFPPGSSATLPRGGSLLRPFSPAVSVAPKTQSGFMSSPERAAVPPRGYSPYSRGVYEEPYYSQYGTRSSSITPIIDEEASDTELLEDGYNLYSGVKLPSTTSNRPSTYGLTTASTVPPFDATRLRVEHMERQLANLTGLVQKALTQTVPTSSPRDHDLSVSDKSVSFEKSVSFSDDPPEINSPKQHSPQHTDSKPTKPAIKSSTLPRTSSQERERLKPLPPPKPLTISSATYDGHTLYRDLQLTPEMYNQLRGLQKKAKDLRQEVRNLRRMSQAQARSVKETVRDTYVKIRSIIISGGESLWSGGADSERIKISREEDIYKQDIMRLEDDLTELESTVEELRSNVINRKTRVNMSDVENMALILSKSSKTVADLKLKFPLLQNSMKSLMSLEMERIVSEESFLKDEPERLDSALKRCKKLTGTLVTLKRLASVQEQRLPDNRLSPTADEIRMNSTTGKNDGTGSILGSSNHIGSGGRSSDESNYSENTFDSLLEELQTTKCSVPNSVTLRRLHSFPSSDNKPPVPERHADLSTKRVPPPPPPRTSSKSPLASPTNPNAQINLVNSPMRKRSLGSLTKILKDKVDAHSPSTSSSCESINSQEGIQQTHLRQEQLELRHQELLKKQKALQEQYSRLQQLQKTSSTDILQLKKTGSESNILAKMGLGLSATTISGSLSHLVLQKSETSDVMLDSSVVCAPSTNTVAKTKIYETDIL